MVTLENVLEELVGPIEDEFDQEEPLIRQIDGQTWELNGSWPMHKLAELVDQRLGETAVEDVCTVSGLMTQRLGRFPRVGDELVLGAWELRVEEMTGTRVMRMKLKQRSSRDQSTPTESDPPTGLASPRRTKPETADQNELVSTAR